MGSDCLEAVQEGNAWKVHSPQSSSEECKVLDFNMPNLLVLLVYNAWLDWEISQTIVLQI
jgi:hypothetical protein